MNPANPARILEQSASGGPAPGRAGVVLARAGAGKSALLVHLALDAIEGDEDVLHVVLGDPLDQVEAWYDALLDLGHPAGVRSAERRATLLRRRAIQSYASGELEPDQLSRTLRTFVDHTALRPSLVVVDGLRWAASAEARQAQLRDLSSAVGGVGARLWVTAELGDGADAAEDLLAPGSDLLEHLDLALVLEPSASEVSLRIGHDRGGAPGASLRLDPATLAVQPGTLEPLTATDCTLLSGAANGAEAEFGACAEAWGLTEINFSFPGRSTARARGVVELSDAELHLGEVSSAYLETQLHRRFPNTPMFRKMLQTIWHQVTTAGEVFVVGLILPDNTVNGGTGWAAELARHFEKPVHVYDQERHGWFAWSGEAWVAEERPRITRLRFAGTGTRFLSEDGRLAIRALFEDSFGPSPAA